MSVSAATLAATPPKTCELCGALFARGAKDGLAKWLTRRFCSGRCTGLAGAAARSEAERARREQVIEDFEWIVGTEHPERIAARLGFPCVEHLQRNLYRWGRADLVHRLNAQEVAA